MVRLLFLCVALTLAAIGTAGEMYKWTDEKGQVHYTDQPPPEDKPFEKREIKAEPVANTPTAADKGSAPAGAGKPSAGCERARMNLNTFEKSTAVQMDVDGDGNPESLDAEQRERELQRTRDLVKALCGG
jgi:hypothetical protein